MEITGLEYREARAKYYGILGPWTAEVPTFEHFMWHPEYTGYISMPSDNAWYRLTPEAQDRWGIIQSPHAEALVKAWAIKQGS